MTCGYAAMPSKANSVQLAFASAGTLHSTGDANASEGWRIPAREIGQLVRTTIINALRGPLGLLANAGIPLPSPDQLGLLLVHGESIADKLAGTRFQASRALRDLVTEVRLRREQVEVVLDEVRLAKLPAVG